MLKGFFEKNKSFFFLNNLISYSFFVIKSLNIGIFSNLIETKKKLTIKKKADKRNHTFKIDLTSSNHRVLIILLDSWGQAR